MLEGRIGNEKRIDFPYSKGTLEELFPRPGIKNRKKKKNEETASIVAKESVIAINENDENDGFGDFPNEDEEYITY